MSTSRKVVFNISRSYETKQILGEGAYGIVASAIHKPTGLTVAIKKIEPFAKPLICLRTLRELTLLNFFRNHENIIGFYDVQKPTDFASFNEVYLIQEFMPTDLHKLIHTSELSNRHIQYFVYQIARGLKTIHSANVIHRDLKPSNILVNYNCDVKICDFGLARITNSNLSPLESKLTEYVATRWYRAPEIMLSSSSYTTAVDMWSLGCMMAELFLGYPLFPEKDYKHQLLLIFEYLGTPKDEALGCVKSVRAREYIKSLPQSEAVNIPQYFNNHPRRVKRLGYSPVDPAGLDLMCHLLTFEPSKRYTAEETLKHPYLEQYHDPNDEPVTSIKLEPDYFDQQDKCELSIEMLKKHLYREIISITTPSRR